MIAKFLKTLQVLSMQLKAIYKTLAESFKIIVFNRIERIGYHITRNHYYSPIPDTGKLNDNIWLNQSKLVGIDMNEQKQIDLLNRLLAFQNEYKTFPEEKQPQQYQYYTKNPNYTAVDAEILYCIIRHFKPKKLIEIGSGYSTYLSAQALLKNEEESYGKADLIAIEPFPNEVLVSGFPGLTKLITTEVQKIDLSVFMQLKANDILFIDSSHVVRMGNDVQYLYLEILPRLNRKVIIHMHDIFLPFDYLKSWVVRHRLFWNEQYLLQAFLSFNNAYEVLWASAYMHKTHPEKLEMAFSTYNRNTAWRNDEADAVSFWIRKIK